MDIFMPISGNYLDFSLIIRYLLFSNINSERKGVLDDMTENDKWLTVEELAAYLKMSRTKLYAMTQKGEIPASKIGNQWRFDRDEIDEWMKSLREMPQKASVKNG
jgi:excisionase family DNA binding protein